MDDSKYLQVESRPHERSSQRKVGADVGLHSCVGMMRQKQSGGWKDKGQVVLCKMGRISLE